ncbi:MAG: HAMP domain-containing protein [Xanthomonadales bacterium]|nr:HAMP domain-containing protein [Xanthomonadales bacterium]
MSMYAKLALSMVAAGTLALLALALALDWRLGRGFIAYINDADAERLVPLAAAAAEVHRRDGGWAGLRAQPERVAWRALHARVRALEDDSSTQALPTPPAHAARAPRQRPPAPRHGREPPPPWTPFWARVAIHDSEGQPVLGRHALAATHRRLPVEVDGVQVGWVGLVELRHASGRLGQAFLADQRRGLVVAALVMLVALALAAMALARVWTGPVRRIGSVARRLADGDLGARVGPAGRDEIGALARDVDQLGQSLAAADAARRRWMADTAHELRTPLAVLKGELEALLDGVRPLDRDAVASLHAEATHLGALINELRELALADLGALDYRMADLAFDALVDECLSANAGRLAQHGLTVGWTRPARPVQVHGDARRLRQLVENLLENSLRYTDRGGRIAVTLTAGPDGLHLDWQDSAPGVPPAMLGQLFEPFVRGDPARARDEAGAGRGSGLGLAIVRRIVQAHGGTIAASPSALGGLALRIDLPITGEAA